MGQLLFRRIFEGQSGPFICRKENQDEVFTLTEHRRAYFAGHLFVTLSCGSISASNSESRTRVSLPILTRVRRPCVSHQRIVEGATPPSSSAADSTLCKRSGVLFIGPIRTPFTVNG